MHSFAPFHPLFRRRLIVGASATICVVFADVAVRLAEPTLQAYDLEMFDNEDFERKPAQLRHMASLPDIVLMGSSRARYAFVPGEFEIRDGLHAYNLGINGAQTVEWLSLARQVFSDRRPRLIVLGVNAGEFRADYRPRVAARFSFSFGDLLESLVMDGASPDVVAPYLRHLIGPSWATYERRYQLKMWAQQQLGGLLPAYAKQARDLCERVARRYPPEARQGPPKGYDHPWIHGRRKHELGTAAGSAVSSIPRFSESAGAFGRLDQFLGWLQEHGIDVVVAYVPNSPKIERRWARIEPRMILTIDFICRARGVPFLRCEQADLPRRDADYLDEVHVGWPLARRISRRVARYVEDLGILHVRGVRHAATSTRYTGAR